MTQEHLSAVNEAGLRKLLAKGWHLVVVCYAKPEFRPHQWYGDWGMRVVRPDGIEECRLVLSRAPFDERRFASVSTVINFLDKYGFVAAHIPLRVGGRMVNVPSISWDPD